MLRAYKYPRAKPRLNSYQRQHSRNCYKQCRIHVMYVESNFEVQLHWTSTVMMPMSISRPSLVRHVTDHLAATKPCNNTCETPRSIQMYSFAMFAIYHLTASKRYSSTDEIHQATLTSTTAMTASDHSQVSRPYSSTFKTRPHTR